MLESIGMSFQERTVLLVEDTEDSRVVLKRTLEIQGYHVLEAGNGLEALELVKDRCPDLILMDLNMPGLDGLGAIEQIRQREGRCVDVPIIVMTAFDTYGMKQAAMEVGCNEYIKKPLGLDSLAIVLRGYLEPPL
jgi:CheY-like chemotaxis protein